MKPEIAKILAERMENGDSFLIAEYRGSHIGERSFVDKTDGKKKSFIGASHILERGRGNTVETVKLSQRVPDSVTDPKDVPVRWERGKVYAFPISRLVWKNGMLEASLGEGEVVPL